MCVCVCVCVCACACVCVCVCEQYSMSVACTAKLVDASMRWQDACLSAHVRSASHPAGTATVCHFGCKCHACAHLFDHLLHYGQ